MQQNFVSIIHAKNWYTENVARKIQYENNSREILRIFCVTWLGKFIFDAMQVRDEHQLQNC